MPKLDLPSVTLLCVDCFDVERVIPIVEKCKEKCNFGAVKVLTSLPTDYEHRVQINHLPSHISYSIFMLKKANVHVDTKHALVVQHDGWILNSAAWNPSWLDYDYIGPLFIHRHHITDRSVGTGGFSFRSKALMDVVCSKLPEWDESESGTASLQRQLGSYEDGVISINLRHFLERSGFKYASAVEASKFAQGGNCDSAYHVERPFGFHGLWPNIDFDSGVVSPWPK